MRGIRYNDRVFIQGKTGSGKTVLANHLFQAMSGCRRTAVDPKGRLQIGVEPAHTPGELDLAAPVSHYIPPITANDDAEYEELFSRLWHAGGPRLVFLDESYGPTRAGYAPPSLRRITQQGREQEIGLIANSQRPVNVEVTLISEADHVIMFVPPPPKKDLQTLAESIGVEADALRAEMVHLLAQHGKHSHVWYVRDEDERYLCPPVPLPKAPRRS